jgi:protein-S-isoprenylcysteine O-methyltransferase Ste14
MQKTLSASELRKIILTRMIPALIFIPLIIFLPAWTFNYWEGWTFIGCLLIPMFIVLTYLIKNDPKLLIRRMKLKEKRSEQKLIVSISYPVFLLAFILPGFDHRLGWSSVPPAVVFLALFCFLAGYFMFFQVLRENTFLSRIVEVADGQKVISTGLYAIVRHPMYLSTVIIYLFSPLALGSYWAMIPALFVIPVLVARILDEEKTLVKELPGYEEYTRKVRYRLFPALW